MNLDGRVEAALETAVRHLAGLAGPDGYWEGKLSSSALSTATAISALAPAGREEDRELIERGLAWLARTQNEDGGWGDTPDSPSNLSTTILALCAMRISCMLPVASCLLQVAAHQMSNVQCPMSYEEDGSAETGHSSVTGNWQLATGNLNLTMERAEQYVTARAGRTAAERVAAIRNIYGEDRTFATPILMNCALAGLVPWSAVPPLPFELALLPRGFYKAVRLHVVSYALPALIAVGALIHARNPTKNPVARALRGAALRPALGQLAGLQPASGGFLEATPLTSFVGMSLVALAGATHPVAAKCLEFLRASARADGSWPIDSNLAVWVTTGAVGALARAGALNLIDGEKTRKWIAARQWRQIHPFTGAAPGAYAWTHLSGGVPDADDTAGAILALGHLKNCGLRIADCGLPFNKTAGGDKQEPSIAGAVKWLLDLQNTDGGWPTFCRGWGKLPFDRSAPDLTAHVLRSLMSVDDRALSKAIARGFDYLERTQRPDGSWVPLWFGNQHAARHENPVLGTARVLLAWAGRNAQAPSARRGFDYLVAAQNADGGWGGGRGVVSTTEETALAVGALAHFKNLPGVKEAMESGVRYLAGRVEDGTWLETAPIGLYFASLWYSEAMYPVIWAVEALGAVLRG